MRGLFPTCTGICSVVLLLGLTGCAREVSQEELIADAVRIRVEKWRESQLELCREKALERADVFVDSLLLAISLQSKLDTIPKPEKPVKPEKPPFREKPDSVVIRKLPEEDR